MKTARILLSLAFLALLASFAHGADRAGVEGILIAASNKPGQSDGRLAPYEPTLKRILRFQSYRFIGSDSGSVNVPGEGSLSVGQGQQLQITADRADGSGIHVGVRWNSGGRSLMNTRLVLRPGVPAVLGGPSTGNGDEVYAVILIGR
jgi:hypothetical protein